MQNEIWIGTISIVGNRTPLVKALRQRLGTAASVDGTRVDDAFVGGVWIPGCVLYRLSRRQKLKPIASEVRK